MYNLDSIAYNSKLKNIDPLPKLWVSLYAMFFSVFANSIIISLLIFLTFAFLIIKKGKTSVKIFLKVISIPMSFLIIGIFTIILQKNSKNDDFIICFYLFKSYFGISKLSIFLSIKIFLNALASLSALYFLSLTTPMIEILQTLKKLKVPKLFIEICELIYRFIFILLEGINKIYVAQLSRQGYNGFFRSLKSASQIASMVFERAFKRSDKIYTSLEARGYNGEITTLTNEYVKNKLYYIYVILFAVFLVLVLVIERKFLK